MDKPSWNIRGLIKSLGGVQRLPARFKSVGVQPPPLNTMIGWRRRNSAPSEWLLAMLDIARHDPTMPTLDELVELMREDI